MFDELYDKIKKSLMPKAVKELEKNKESSLANSTPNLESQKAETLLPTVPKANTDSASLATTRLSTEEKKELHNIRRNVPLTINILKYSSVSLLVISLVVFLWLKFDLEPTNKYLSAVNLSENTGLKFENLSQQEKALTDENRKYDTTIKKLESQLYTKKYSVHSETIQNIKDEQLIWFDQRDNDNKIQYGLLDSPDRMEEYFNSKTFDDSILTGTGNHMVVDNVTANRNEISFSVVGSHLFGKVFFLNTEFVKMMNSFPFLKDGSVNSFSKKKDKEGNDSMSFSLKLKIQRPEETDPYDEYFPEYENWLLSPISNQ
ncbi:hypothetical protein K9M41_03985 [Candidatus Gracilibacteria bacterium]|nr:hypothetical protein [Candidatus Gracilibacteria bacterium]